MPAAPASGPALRPMRAAEYPAWLAHMRADYVEQLVSMAGFARADAEAKGASDYEILLPAGLDTPGNHFFMAEAGGEVVATLWLGEKDDEAAGPLVWVYDVETLEPFRRRGHARAVMGLAEQEARRLGYARIGLNVFAGNAPAIALYESLGYELLRTHPGGRNLVKDLA